MNILSIRSGHNIHGGFICCSKGLKQPKYPFVGHWLNTGWHVHSTEYCVPVEKTEAGLYSATWNSLQGLV